MEAYQKYFRANLFFLSKQSYFLLLSDTKIVMPVGMQTILIILEVKTVKSHFSVFNLVINLLLVSTFRKAFI